MQVNATITAWYTDPVSAKSGYQVLLSNGRLEADFLDRLQEALSGQSSSASTMPGASSTPLIAGRQSNPARPAVSPSPPDNTTVVKSRTAAGSPLNLGDPLRLDHMSSLATQKAVVDRHTEEQEKEAKGLEKILRNQAHPANLVAVRKKDTPVLANPIEDAKVLFSCRRRR